MLSQSGSLEFQIKVVSTGVCALQRLWGQSLPHLLQIPVTPVIPSLVASSLQSSSLSTWFSPSVCLLPLCLSRGHQLLDLGST